MFVQSTSWNRKIPAGVHIMVEVTQKESDKYGEDGDIRNQDEKETVGKKKGVKAKKGGTR